MISRFLLLICLLATSTLTAFADEPALSESPENLQDFVASFNLGRPKDFPPLLVEDVVCARELRSENNLVAHAFPHLPDTRLSKAAIMSADKPQLRAFRQTLAEVVARRKAPQVKADAASSTRFGPAFRELGQNVLTLISDIDAALKIDKPGTYFAAARRVRQDAQGLADALDHSSRAFKHLSYEYDTVTALSNGKPRPVWKEPEPSIPATPHDSPLDVQIS